MWSNIDATFMFAFFLGMGTATYICVLIIAWSGRDRY